MLKVIILDNNKINKSIYLSVFKKSKVIELLDVVSNQEEFLTIIKKYRVDLLVLSINISSYSNILELKKICRKNFINLIISSCKKDLKGLEMVKYQLREIVYYASIRQESLGSKNIVVIASSTGGPKALQEIIPRFPSNLNAIIIIVQHMPANFTHAFAKRLDSMSALKVKEAENNEVLEKGIVYIAPGDYHMLIKCQDNKLYSALNKEDKYKGVRPAADLLMESISRIENYEKIGVVLTGMGKDGAKGVTYLKKGKGYNIVQDEATSIIFGMPKAAIETKSVDEVTPLDSIWKSIMLKVGCSYGYRY